MASKEAAPKAKPAAKKTAANGEMIAIVRVRSSNRRSGMIDDALKRLNLHKQNYCVVVPNTPSYIGMIKKVKDYVTFGIATPETLQALDKKREKHPRIEGENKAYVRLSPPLKGYGREGIKKTFKRSGALGDRGEKINDLVKRMIHE